MITRDPPCTAPGIEGRSSETSDHRIGEYASPLRPYTHYARRLPAALIQRDDAHQRAIRLDDLHHLDPARRRLRLLLDQQRFDQVIQRVGRQPHQQRDQHQRRQLGRGRVERFGREGLHLRPSSRAGLRVGVPGRRQRLRTQAQARVEQEGDTVSGLGERI